MHTAKDLATFAKKKGFIYPSSEIYGGVAGLYDYGHLGTLLKHNFQNQWRKYFLGLHPNFFEIEAAEVMHEHVFVGSGHLKNFIDPILHCSQCDFSERADHFAEKHVGERVEGLLPEQLTQLIEQKGLVCPKCKGKFKPVDVLNMMFPLKMGVGSTNTAYLRPETAQSPYVNFKAQYELQRKKLPLGLGLIGRAYRNEISPRNLTLRQRAFTQAELQLFFDPATILDHPKFSSIRDYPLRTMLVQDRESSMIVERTAESLVEEEGLPRFYVYHLAIIQKFYFEILAIPKSRFRLYQLNDTEKAFYNKYHFDIEVKVEEHEWIEVGGLHYRTDHDLKGHQSVSGQSMEVLDEASGKKFIPHVLELSFGVDRNVYALLDLHYEQKAERGNDVLHLPNRFAPFYCAVFPLVKNKEPVVHKARKVYSMLREAYSCFYDEASSVGRRYARADEVGVRYCITVDFETLEDEAVTLRDRETMQQQRVRISELKNKLFELYFE